MTAFSMNITSQRVNSQQDYCVDKDDIFDINIKRLRVPTAWGNFKGCEILDSNCREVKILDDRAMFMRFDIDVNKVSYLEANVDMANGYNIWAKLRKCNAKA